MSERSTSSDLFVPRGGLPSQHELLSGRAVTTESYAVIPRGVLTDIVVSFLPHWRDTRLWVLARPMSGFSTTFSHYLMDIALGFARDAAEFDPSCWSQGEFDVPILETALACFECTREFLHEGGDHTIVIGRVEYATLGSGAPLLFYGGAFGEFRRAP